MVDFNDTPPQEAPSVEEPLTLAAIESNLSFWQTRVVYLEQELTYAKEQVVYWQSKEPSIDPLTTEPQVIG